MKNKTLNLEASKLIASLGIECESEKYHLTTTEGEYEGVFSSSAMECSSSGYKKPIFAPNLQELLALLPAIGEKLKLPKLANQLEENECEFSDGVMTTNTFIAHNLLDIYLTNYDMEDVSREILNIVNKI